MKLTPVEALLFEVLKKMPDGAPRHILKEVKPPPIADLANRVDVHIKNLRRKVKEEGLDIVSIRGFGYRLVQQD